MVFRAKPLFERHQEVFIGFQDDEPFEWYYDLLDTDGYVSKHRIAR